MYASYNQTFSAFGDRLLFWQTSPPFLSITFTFMFTTAHFLLPNKMTSTVRLLPASVKDQKLEKKYVEIGFPKYEFLTKSAYYVDDSDRHFKDKNKAAQGIGVDARNVGAANTDQTSWTWYDTRSSWLQL